MPNIMELRKIDGAMWARVDLPEDSPAGSVTLWTESEVREAKRAAVRVAFMALADKEPETMPPLTTEAILQEFGQAASGDAEAILRMADEIARLRALLNDNRVERLRAALHATIARPTGVVPDIALEFYDPKHPALGKYAQR